MFRSFLAAVLFAVALSRVLPAQQPSVGASRLAEALTNSPVQAALAAVDASESRAVQTLIALGSIVSPSGHEQERAKWVAERMRAIGL
ncbi:MAG: hypothetical protein HY700_03640 [Gemmatimonadetes bacterium]|nr:hypothetical protein [Gemmatimonadota bacterium]